MPESTREILRAGPRRWPRLLAAVITLAAISALVYTSWPGSPAKNASNPTSVAGTSSGQTVPAGAGSPAGATPAGAAGSQAGAASSQAGTAGSRAGAAGSRAGAPNSPVGPVALKPGNPGHVATWNAGQGGVTLAAISTNLDAALMAHGAREFAQMRRACVSLASDVQSASTQPPIPDSAMQVLYEKALTSLAAGAGKCEAGISSRLEGDEDLIVDTNTGLLDTAMSQLDIGARELYTATYRIKTLQKA